MDDPLDRTTVVLVDVEAPWFDFMTKNWPDEETSRHVRNALLRLDIEHAAQPPVINVTVPGIYGHFTAVAGQDEVSWSAAPAPETGGAVVLGTG